MKYIMWFNFLMKGTHLEWNMMNCDLTRFVSFVAWSKCVEFQCAMHVTELNAAMLQFFCKGIMNFITSQDLSVALNRFYGFITTSYLPLT